MSLRGVFCSLVNRELDVGHRQSEHSLPEVLATFRPSELRRHWLLLIKDNIKTRGRKQTGHFARLKQYAGYI